MPDWELSNKRIYQLLKHPSQVDKSVVEDMTSAYLEFVEELFEYLNKGTDNKIRIRELNLSYIDFGTLKALEETCPTENSKLKLVFLDKLLSLINMEQELIYRQMEYPKFFINIESDWKSPFYLNNEVIKLVDMMELVCGIFYIADGIVRVDHKEIFLSDVARVFEKVFNVNLGDIYKKEISVIKRKPTKITEFLDRLKAAIIQKSKDEGYYQP
ncbi:hypothetical protein C799_01224 [Bacteroides thetaiotaomicron dnLKV9]|uniref:RteC protein n=1 Tax=Bacteroides thetaiotaomicron dnLKV9 TaxID=1235785 RepID=R9HDH8_BACT4|nr:RteC domain-containing protein [Bacteroides thetaiotaomicron]EOS02108.1 hypothetical protein C799_01224 [Bacteroides thetaiotaomicron dnLKV9]